MLGRWVVRRWSAGMEGRAQGAGRRAGVEPQRAWWRWYEDLEPRCEPRLAWPKCKGEDGSCFALGLDMLGRGAGGRVSG